MNKETTQSTEEDRQVWDVDHVRLELARVAAADKKAAARLAAAIN